MDTNQKRILAVAVVALVAAALLVPAPTVYGDSDTSAWEGDHDGAVALTASFLDENMQTVGGGVSVAMAILTPNGSRVRYLQLTAEWETTDISVGYDLASFMFQATVALNVSLDNGLEQWSFTYDLPPSGSVDIASASLNGSQVWTIDLKDDLLLETEAKNHGGIYPTYVDLNFGMIWTASMYDTVDSFTDVQSGDPLALLAQCWVERGFWTKPKLT